MAQKRRKNKKNRKILSVVLFLILFIAALVVSYFVWDAYFRDDKKEDESSETVVEEEVEEQKEDTEDVKEDVLELEKEPVAQYEGTSPNKVEGLTGVVTYAAVSGGNLIIRVNIDQYLNSGECMLLLATAGNTVYSNTAPIIGSATTATCEGFNVPVNLLEAGQYSITVEIESGGKKGTIRGEVGI